MPVVVFTMIFVFSGCAQSTPPPSRPSVPQLVGWQRADGRPEPEQSPAQKQAELICRDVATRTANSSAPSVLMYEATLNASLKGCMAQRGYLPLYDR